MPASGSFLAVCRARLLQIVKNLLCHAARPQFMRALISSIRLSNVLGSEGEATSVRPSGHFGRPNSGVKKQPYSIGAKEKGTEKGRDARERERERERTRERANERERPLFASSTFLLNAALLPSFPPSSPPSALRNWCTHDRPLTARIP